MGMFIETYKDYESIGNLNFRPMPQTLELKIQLLTNTAKLPTKSHPTDACFDIYADIPDADFEFNGRYFNGICINPHATALIPTGFATEIPHGFWGAIFARSGLASKQGLRPAQGVPVIDEPYRGMWKIPLHNDSEEIQIVHHGDRICQFMLLPYFDTTLTEVYNLSSTDRGEDGFGSTGL